MDELKIDMKSITFPKYGEIKFIIKNGKIVQYIVTESHILKENGKK